MRDGVITPVTARHIHPVVYIDVDITAPDESEVADEVRDDELCEITAYPGLRCKLLTASGPGGGNPVYRIEGPLSQLIDWLISEYASGGELDTYTPLIGLAR